MNVDNIIIMFIREVNSAAVICGTVSSDISSIMPISLIETTTVTATANIIKCSVSDTFTPRVEANSLSKAV